MENKKIRTTVPEGEESQPIEIMEKAIVDLATGMKKLTGSRLKESVIVTLLVRATGVGRGDIEKVLSHLSDLESLFLKPKSKK